MYVRMPLCFTATLVCHPDSNLPDGQSAPRQKYISCLVLALARNNNSDISPTRHNFYRGVLKVRNLASVCHLSSFSIQAEQHIGNRKQTRRTPMTGLCPPLPRNSEIHPELGVCPLQHCRAKWGVLSGRRALPCRSLWEVG